MLACVWVASTAPMPESFAARRSTTSSHPWSPRSSPLHTRRPSRSRAVSRSAKTLYSAVGQPDNRNRRPATLARAIERLMLLDAVLAESALRWLGTEREKVGYFQNATTLRPNELPHLGFGVPPEQSVRYFPDKLPIGVAPHRSDAPVLVPRKSPCARGLSSLPPSPRGTPPRVAELGGSLVDASTSGGGRTRIRGSGAPGARGATAPRCSG